MYKKVLSVFLVIALAVTMIPMPFGEAYAADTNENDEPSGFIMPVEQKTEVPEGYIGIYTKTDLNNIRNDLKANYILMNDIEFTKEDFQEGGEFPQNWIPIEGEFEGIFDGNGYKICGLKIISKGEPIGLFGNVKGTIVNLTLKDLYIHGSSYCNDKFFIGTIAAKVSGYGKIQNCNIIGATTVYIYNIRPENESAYYGNVVGTIEDKAIVEKCSNSASIIYSISSGFKPIYVGGIAGNVGETSTISNCSNIGKFDYKNSNYLGNLLFVGGVAGNTNGTIQNCNNSGELLSLGNVGGIAGISNGLIVNCSNSGIIDSLLNAAGIAAVLDGNSTIKQCYNTGKINVNGYDNRDFVYAGGIAGEVISGAKITGCYNDSEILYTQRSENCVGYSGGIAGKSAGTIENCHNKGNLQSDSSVGGITGITTGTITECYNSGLISSSISAAGIAAISDTNSVIIKCYNTGKIDVVCNDDIYESENEYYGSDAYAGGIAAEVLDNVKITDCYNIGKVNLIQDMESYSGYVGGIAGTVDNIGTIELPDDFEDLEYYENKENDDTEIETNEPPTIIKNCYNSGRVYGEGISLDINIGGIAGCIFYNVLVTDCYNTAEIYARVLESYLDIYTITYVGGIVGFSFEGTITMCYNTGTIRTLNHGLDESYNAGIVSYVLGGGVSRCYNEGSVYSYSNGHIGVVGGIAGDNSSDKGILDCFNIGYVSVNTIYETYTFLIGGGISGINSSKIDNCYNAGYIDSRKSKEYIDAIAGDNAPGEVKNSYYLYNICASDCKGAYRLKYSSMEQASSYKEFDFDEIWQIDSTDYSFPYIKGLKKPTKIPENKQIELFEYNVTITGKYEYTGKEIKPYINVSHGGRSLTVNEDYTLKIENNVNAGTAKVTVTGIDEYKGIVEKTFEILPIKANACAVVLSDTSYYYDGQTKTPSVTVYGNGLILDLNKDYRVKFDDGRKDAGIYGVTVELIGNYQGEITRYFTIERIRETKFNATISQTSYCYDGKVKTPSVTVKDSHGNTLKLDKDYKLYYDSGRKNIGFYEVAVELIGNYSGSTTLGFTIGPKDTSAAKAKLTGHDDIKISWKKVKGAKGYNVYYKKAGASSYKKLTTTTGNPIKGDTYYCRKLNLDDGTKYYFKVCAYKKVNGIECQNNGKTLSVTTLKKVKSVKAKKSGSKVKISWSNISGESGYQISKSTSKSKTGTITTYKTTKGKSKTISATKGKTYYYKVRAYKTVNGKKIYGPWSSVVKYKR